MSATATRRGLFILDLKGNATEGFKALRGATDDATKAYQAHDNRAEQAAAKLASLGGVLRAVPIPGFQKLGGAVDMAGKSFQAMLNPVSASIALFGGSVVAVGALTAGIVGLVRSSKDWIASLREIGAADGITAEHEAKILAANNAMDRLVQSATRLGVLLGAEFAPMVGRAATGLEAMSSMLERADTGLARALVTMGPLGLANEVFANSLQRLTGIEFPSYLGMLDSANAKMSALLANYGLVNTAMSRPVNPKKFGESFGVVDDLGAGIKAASGAGAAQLAANKTAAAEAEREARQIEELGQAMNLVWRQADEEAKAKAKRDADMLAAMERTSASTLLLIPGLEAAFADAFATAEAANRSAQGVDAATAAMNVRSTRDVINLVPGLGPLVTGLGDAVLNLPNLVGGIQRDLVQGPLKMGQAFEKTMTKAIPRFIEAIPRMMENLIFKMPFAVAKGIVEGIPKILASIVKAIAEAIANALNFLKGGRDGNFLTGERGKTLGTSFRKGRFSLFGYFGDDDKDAGWRGGGRDGKNDVSRSFAVGTRHVPRTGMYMLHKDEEVRPAHARTRWAGSAGTTINVAALYPRNLDEFIRELQARTGTYGFGGSFSRS